MTAVAMVVSLLVGLGAGFLVQRAAARFVPVSTLEPVAATAGGGASGEGELSPRSVSVRVPAVLTVAATAVLCGLAGLRFGATWQLPAFLLLAIVGVLLAVIDLEHRLLPNRIVAPATAGALALLVLAAAAGNGWTHLRNAVLGAVILFVLFLVLALVTPSGLGMGDVKLSAWLGLHLGWIGMGAVAMGAVAGFVVQAVLALVLLAARQVGVKGEIPFGPALLAGTALAVGGSRWIAGFLGATGKG